VDVWKIHIGETNKVLKKRRTGEVLDGGFSGRTVRTGPTEGRTVSKLGGGGCIWKGQGEGAEGAGEKQMPEGNRNSNESRKERRKKRKIISLLTMQEQGASRVIRDRLEKAVASLSIRRTFDQSSEDLSAGEGGKPKIQVASDCKGPH